MSFFKKIFSKNKAKFSSTTEDKKIDIVKSTEEDGSYEFDFSDGKAYPYFMRYETHELEEGQLASVFHYAQDEKPVVLQTIVLQDEQGMALLDNSEMNDEMLDALDKQAQANISAYDLEFKYHPEYEQKILTAQGPMFTCEAILSEEHMLKAHVMLDAEDIMVAIPRRGVMLVASNDLPDEVQQSFFGLHMHIWLDQKEENDLSRICKDIFVLKHGKIDGVLYLPDPQ